MKGNSLQVNKIYLVILMINKKFGFSWKHFSWSKFREKLCILQAQIFDFIKYKNFKKAIFQQSFLLRSSEIYYLAIRYITQLRLDRKIPGIDKNLIRSVYQRLQLSLIITKKLSFWKEISIKKIYVIDFLRGKTLIFLPSISDRVVQYIWSLALEPVFNSLFFENQVAFSSINKCMFAKYAVVSKLVARLTCKNLNLIYLKWNITDCFCFLFNKNYLLKIVFFPDSYKKIMIDSFKSNIFIHKSDSNENLPFYLNLFHYFLMFFAFSSFKKIFLQELDLKCSSVYKQVNFISSYLNEMICILNKKHVNKDYIESIKKHILGKNFWSKALKINVSKTFWGFQFLDWCFRVSKGCRYKILPSHKAWREYKNRCKQLLNCNTYSFYQRIKFLEILVQSTLYNNWFCSSRLFKKRLYTLKLALHNNVKKGVVLFKYEKRYLLNRIFKNFS